MGTGEYRAVHGLRVPTSVEVGWVLEHEEFTYARFHVTALEYNVGDGAPGPQGSSAAGRAGKFARKNRIASRLRMP